MAWPQAGETAHDFTLPDQGGASVTLSALWAQGPVVLYFYPKDETAGCTAEACSFRDSFEVFRDAGASVVGVSRDSVASHKGFALHHRLPFTLLADVDGAAHRAWGIGKTLGILGDRVTFVIDKKGVIRHTFSSHLRMGAHIQESLAVVKTLAREA
jgi:peroxiredoxin Q/BCP